jgi:ABC-type transport system substrate-binding protein
MMKKKHNKTILTILISLIILSNIISIRGVNNCTRKSWCFLTIKTDSGEHYDYALYICKYLKSIGIKARIQVQEWGLNGNELIQSNTFDLAIIEIEQEMINSYSDFIGIYSEEGILGNFGWIREIPYCNQSESMLKSLNASEHEEDEIEIFNNWMIMTMDNILPVLPLCKTDFYPSITFLVFNLRKNCVGGSGNYEFLDKPGYKTYTKALIVRKAISHAINREEMNIRLNYGVNRIFPYPVFREDFSNLDYEIEYNYNVCRAIELLGLPGYHLESNENSFELSSLIISILTLYCITQIVRRKKKRKRISA